MRIYRKGERVSQATYGPGTVLESDERHTCIDFDGHGIRKFSTRLVALEGTNVPAPARVAKGRRKTAGTNGSRPAAINHVESAEKAVGGHGD